MCVRATATGRKREVVVERGQTGIKGFAAMNVILIKPSRILRFRL